MTTEFLYNFISKNKYAVLSTVTKDNFAEAALVGIAVTTDLKIIFDTVSTSRKYQNLIKNSSIAFVIGWDNEQTMQYEGIAKIPGANELDRLLKVYFNVFPDGRDRKENCKDIAYFCVEPKWIRYADFNNQQIEELNF
jgi:general stress protein 26